MTRRPPPHLRRRRLLGAVAVVAGVACVSASFLAWLTLPDGAGGTTSVAGWGAVTGGAQLSGQNINDFLAGYASYRPGLLPVLAGAVAAVAGIVLALAPGGRHPHRVTAALLALCGLVALGVAVLRVLSPDPVGILQSGEGSPGPGPWVTGACGLVLVAVALSVLLGLVDAPPPVRHRGIQPGR
ncbi:hypothetical protein [Nakamurella endophytica]|nr:hypothetical protein [Nakamurella endophytica]